MSEDSCAKADIVNTEPLPTSQGEAGQSQYVVEEEYIIGIPLIRPSLPFLAILKKAGATGESFTKKEICQFLKNYIGSRRMYDVQDPRVVYCDKDPLGKVFGVEKFTIGEVLDLIVKNCTQVPDTCIKRRRRLVTRPLTSSPSCQSRPEGHVPIDYKQVPPEVSTTSSLRIQVCSAAVVSSSVPPSTTLAKSSIQEGRDEVDGTVIKVKENIGPRTPTKKSSEKGSSDSSDSQTRKRKASVSIEYSDPDTSTYPWYFQVKVAKEEESEVLSVQSKSTVPAEDSTDDLWFVEEDTISVQYESDTYELEYEVDDANDEVESDSDDISSDVADKDVIVLCRDSDKEFWADSSGIDSDTDIELTDADKWLCECSTKNLAIQRYCCRCWKLRPSWLPEKLSDLPKRQGQKPVSSSDTDTNVRQSSSRRRIRRQNSKTLPTSVITETTDCTSASEEQLLRSMDSGVGMSLPSSQDTKEPSSSNVSIPNSENSKSLPNLGVRTTLSNFRHRLSDSANTKHSVQKLDTSTSSSSLDSSYKNSPTKTLKFENWQERLASQTASISDPCVICMSKPKTGASYMAAQAIK
ncbi:hypothetical protein ScPMuIL_012281 [Solemya velum]